MSAPGATRSKLVGSFRTRLFSAIMVIVATLTALGFYLAQRRVTADAERNLQQSFQTELSSMHKVEELRYVALVDRCNTLVSKPRIHAAIEDDAIDLLYPTATDELRDLMKGAYPELVDSADRVAKVVEAEEKQFDRVLNAGMSKLWSPR